MHSRCPQCKVDSPHSQQLFCSRCGSRLYLELDKGDILDSRFEILEKLPEGDGGMASVYKARPLAGDGIVAIKLAHDASYEFDALAQEGRVLGQLNHPHIVRAFPLVAGVSPERAYSHKIYIQGEPKNYIALEFIDGGSLRARLLKGPPLTLAEIVRITRQVASALDYAHTHGLVHQDVKPPNILLSADGQRAVLTDFGIVQDVRSQHENYRRRIVGTIQYMPPEQLTGGKVDGRADVYALGIVLYEMLTGRTPFCGKTTTETIRAIHHDEPPPLSKFRKRLPRGLDPVVRKALAKRPEDRYQSCGELAEALEATIRQRKRPVWLGVALGVLAITGAAWALLGTGIIKQREPAAATPSPTTVTEVSTTPIPSRTWTMTLRANMPTRAASVKVPTFTVPPTSTSEPTQTPTVTHTPTATETPLIWSTAQPCKDQKACITDVKADGKLLYIIGSANIPAFERYTVSYKPARLPDTNSNWRDIVDRKERVPSGELARWDVRGLPAEDYDVRLRVIKPDGNYGEYIVCVRISE